MIWLLWIACGDKDPTSELAGCEDRCEAINTRKMALAEACGAQEAGAPEPCDASSVNRVDCIVACIEDEGCGAIDGSVGWDPQWTWSNHEYANCLAECPGIAE
ncbi:MAG: hypothetical protein GY913_07355 [Proteobacteria bacterium]|nr:hypothetical protein [Pseudomonadota bacterium]MCP4916726.1 hypothetical protein [Pseudomonadota bacterium]